MILYHFTYPKHLPAILREGLKPADGSASEGKGRVGGTLTGNREAVWLTPEPTLVPSRRKREIWLTRGMLFGPRSSNLPLATVCLKVIIPSHDKKLKQYFPWLCKHQWEGGPDVNDELLLENNDWLYFGTIAASRVSVFKHVPVTPTSWEITKIREAWLKGAEIKMDQKLIDDILDGREGPEDYIAAHKEKDGKP